MAPSPASSSDDDPSITPEVKAAWIQIYQVLDSHILSSKKPQPPSASAYTTTYIHSILPSHALAALQEAGLGSLVLEYVVEGLDQELLRVVCPQFWQYFATEEKDEDDDDAGPPRSAKWIYQQLLAALDYAKEALQEREACLAAVAEAVLGNNSSTNSTSNNTPTHTPTHPHIHTRIRREQATLRTRLAAIVFNTAPPAFHGWLATFFRSSLRAWHKAWRRRQHEHHREDDSASENEEDIMSVEGEGENNSKNNPPLSSTYCPVIQHEIDAAWHALRRLGWLPLVQSVITNVMKREAEGYITRSCKGEYETPRLGQVRAWKDAVLMPWLERLMEGHEEEGGGEGAIAMALSPVTKTHTHTHTSSSTGFQEWRLRHDFAVYEIFAGVRMGEMFDIIRDFPDSLPAVQELRAALEITQQHRQLASSLRESMRKRLLHNGANTMQIIDVYIATIKALRVVDPTDVLLEAVARPIRAYLQARKDTVRCIVTSLTDESGGGDLYEELRRQDALPLEQGVDSDDEDGGPGHDWMPPSRDADVSSAAAAAAAASSSSAPLPGLGASSAAQRRRGDILSMLISIYGSKDLFVSEYRLMLADKLLSNLDYNTDKEVQNLELLKLRFGEATLQPCEIMIRDVEDSKRVNTNIHSTLKGQVQTHTEAEMEVEVGGGKTKTVEEKTLLLVAKEEAATAVDFTIVSHHFWPPLQEEELQLHPRMAARFDKYGESFSVLKNPRKLDFKQQLGSVHLELDFDNGVSRAFTVAPVHATLIMHFEDDEGWEQHELARLTGLAPEVVAKKMMFWANQGVVQVANGGGAAAGGGGGNSVTYTLLKNQDADGPAGRGLGTSGPTNLEEDELEAAVSSDAQEAQEMGVYISYILGMLGTYGGRPVRAIHDTLKIWAGDQNYTMKLPELERILSRLVLEEKIECVDGAYQLPNRPAGNHHR